MTARPIATFAFLLFVAAASTLSIAPKAFAVDEPADDRPLSELTNEQLIDKLVEVSEPGIGYGGHFTGSDFLPYDDAGHVGMLTLGHTYPHRSEVLTEIVSRGAAAVPTLLEHLDDARPVAMPPLQGLMWMSFDDEYDYNRRTRQEPPAGVNCDTFNEDEDFPNEHAVTVGDLCFVALGQIVNRGYSATRYQPTGGLVVSSPSYSERLRAAALEEWSGLTEEQHRQSLLDDFTQPDYGGRRSGAYLRLSYYYPEEIEPLVTEYFELPTVDSLLVADFCRDTLYKAETEDERERLLDDFLSRHGDYYLPAIETQLFNDLEQIEVIEEIPRAPQVFEFDTQPRELLIQLFHHPADIRSDAAPPYSFPNKYDHIRFISGLTRDDSRAIGDLVLQEYRANPEDAYLAEACFRCLANRGYGEFLVQQIDVLDQTADQADYQQLQCLEAICTSRDPLVVARLEQLLRETTNPDYLVIALPATGDLDRQAVLERAREILAQLPDDTTEGQQLLALIRREYPAEAVVVLKEFLEPGTTSRAETMCVVLWYGDPLAFTVLAPLLDDQRELTGYSVPMRVCDRAAQAISHAVEQIDFDCEWSTRRKNEQIKLLRDYCEQRTQSDDEDNDDGDGDEAAAE